jgi:hypothetical protein
MLARITSLRLPRQQSPASALDGALRFDRVGPGASLAAI